MFHLRATNYTMRFLRIILEDVFRLALTYSRPDLPKVKFAFSSKTRSFLNLGVQLGENIFKNVALSFICHNPTWVRICSSFDATCRQCNAKTLSLVTKSIWSDGKCCRINLSHMLSPS